jgi:hypothetical protein
MFKVVNTRNGEVYKSYTTFAAARSVAGRFNARDERWINGSGYCGSAGAFRGLIIWEVVAA